METLLNPAQQLFRWPSTIMSPPQPRHSFHYGPAGDETGHQELSDCLFVLFDTTPVGGNLLLAPLSGWGGVMGGGENLLHLRLEHQTTVSSYQQVEVRWPRSQLDAASGKPNRL